MIFVAIDQSIDNCDEECNCVEEGNLTGVKEGSWLYDFNSDASFETMESKFKIYLIGVYWIVTTVCIINLIMHACMYILIA